MPVGRNKLAQFRQPYGKRTAAMPELRKLVPAYIFRHGHNPRVVAEPCSYAENLRSGERETPGGKPLASRGFESDWY